jgi:hypothetical protein
LEYAELSSRREMEGALRERGRGATLLDPKGYSRAQLHPMRREKLERYLRLLTEADLSVEECREAFVHNEGQPLDFFFEGDGYAQAVLDGALPVPFCILSGAFAEQQAQQRDREFEEHRWDIEEARANRPRGYETAQDALRREIHKKKYAKEFAAHEAKQAAVDKWMRER